MLWRMILVISEAVGYGMGWGADLGGARRVPEEVTTELRLVMCWEGGDGISGRGHCRGKGL